MGTTGPGVTMGHHGSPRGPGKSVALRALWKAGPGSPHVIEATPWMVVEANMFYFHLFSPVSTNGWLVDLRTFFIGVVQPPDYICITSRSACFIFAYT